MAALARARRVPLVFDAGSGLVTRAVADEPLVPVALAEGADLVCFSGDKLFGGPQAGIVVGSADLLAPLRRHPLLRALRPDKMQLAALEATAVAHLESSTGDLPVWRMLDAPAEEIARRAGRLARRLRAIGYDAATEPGESVTGGGSLPGQGISTTVVTVRHPADLAADLARRLRAGDPPVVVRVENGKVVVDLRTVHPKEDPQVAAAFRI